MKLLCWFDGCCEPINPGGSAAYGALIRMEGERASLWSESKYLGSGPGYSNNVAEYCGIIAVFEKLLEIGFEHRAVVQGDSQLVVKQLNGEWKAHGGLYLASYINAARLKARLADRVIVRWIPREQNTEADELSKRVLVERGVKFRIQSEGAR